MQIPVPDPVMDILSALETAGYAAWCVGGCVRDSLMHKTPHDWDITTSADARTMMRLFENRRVIPTGLAHGTVTVTTDIGPVEITTYRTDGAYVGHRRPAQVLFTDDLHEDLKRRDFTVNAMAYHPGFGLVDDFDGVGDLKRGLLRAVGDPAIRFEEDALRILRAVRFAAVLGFCIEPQTFRALMEKRDDLRYISGERIAQELGKLVCGRAALPVLRACAPVLDAALEAEQQVPWPDRLPDSAQSALCALLLTRSACALDCVLKRLRLPTKTKALAQDAACVRDALAQRQEPAQILLLLGPQRALQALDVLAAWGGEYEQALAQAKALLTRQGCWEIGALAIDGQILRRQGLCGAQIGQAQRALLRAVALENCPNTPAALLAALPDILEKMEKTGKGSSET